MSKSRRLFETHGGPHAYPFSLTAVVFLAAALIPTDSALSLEFTAQPVCDQRNKVLGHLARKYQEAPVAIGVTNRGGLVEVLSTGDGKTWTIIISTPDGQSCLVAAGEGFRLLPPPVEKDPMA